MNLGLDVLGGAKYKDLLEDEWPQGFYMGIFAEAFGDAVSTVSAVLHTNRCPGVRVQLVWDGLHSYGKHYSKKVVELSKKYNQVAKKFPNCRVELSPFCEHNIPTPDTFLDLVAENAPLCFPVNTPWKGGLSHKYKNEVHGTAKPLAGNYNFSFDGTNCVDTNVTEYKQKHSSSDVFYFWHPRFNGKWSMNDKTGIVGRKGWPDEKLLDSVIYLRRDRGETEIPKTWLLKSHSERHGANDFKGDHLLMISPIKTDSIKLRARSGQLIDTLKYYGPYTEGGFRYYSNTWGYLVAERARRIQGDSLLDVWESGKKYGVVNPAFRQNRYRD